MLAVAEDGTERRRPLSSLADAAEFVGADLFPDGVPDDDSPLAIDPDAARVLGEFYDFAARALEALLATTAPADDSSAINLWPEHFDLAFESGPEALGRRANYGASPGDEQHAEPYLYVGPWQDQGGESCGTPPPSAGPSSTTPSWWPPRIRTRSRRGSSPSTARRSRTDRAPPRRRGPPLSWPGAIRGPHRRRRLSRAERRDPGDRAQGDRHSRTRDRRLSRRLARAPDRRSRAADARVDARDPAPRRDDPRHLTHQSLQARRRPGGDRGDDGRAGTRWADRDRR